MCPIEIYWQDITQEKQAEILSAFGDNNNYDVFPIAVIEAESSADDSYADGWICTDDGSCQHIRHLEDRKYEIIDSVYLPDGSAFVCRRVIDLTDYEINDSFNSLYLNPFDYKDAADVRRQYGDSADQIIAECIAKTEIWERENTVFSGSQEDCRKYILAVVEGKEAEHVRSGE